MSYFRLPVFTRIILSWTNSGDSHECYSSWSIVVIGAWASSVQTTKENFGIGRSWKSKRRNADAMLWIACLFIFLWQFFHEHTDRILRIAHRNCTVHIVKFDHCLVYPHQSLCPLSPITFAIVHLLSWGEWIPRSNYASFGSNDASILDWIWELSFMIDDHVMVLPIHPVQHMSPCHQS